MKNKKQNDEGKLLFAVNYVEISSLKDVPSIRTHSIKCALSYVRDLLKLRDDVLYAQVVVYRYSSISEIYRYVTIRNFYGSSSMVNDCNDMLFDLIMED